MTEPSSYQKNTPPWWLIYLLCLVVFLLSPPLGIIGFVLARYDAKKKKRAKSSFRFGQNQQQNYGQSNQYQSHSRLTDFRRGRTARLVGAVLGGLFTMLSLVVLFNDFNLLLRGRYSYVLSELSLLLPFAVGFILLSVWGHNNSKQAMRNREYLTILSNADAISLRELSHVTGVSYQRVCQDLGELVAMGALGNSAYIDMSVQHLILNEQGRQRVAEQFSQGSNQTAESGTAPEKEDAYTEQEGILSQIRQVNDDIADPRLSEQIGRIEEITRQILRYEQEHPEQHSQLRSFLSYYLPTTLKILNAYAELERQSIQGRNITETRHQIERTMDKVVVGFENQLDQLFANSRMDINSEIQVLENMLKRDGLSQEADHPFQQLMH